MSSGTNDATGSSEELQWYAIWTSPRHEKRVADRIREKDLDVFLPLYTVERQWKKRARTEIELPLFDGYVFVRMSDSRRGAVLSTPGVVSILGNRRHALPVPNEEIEALRAGLSLTKPEPHPYLTVGTKVLIKRGPLANLTGILLQIRGKSRVVIAIESIMKAISVEISPFDLDPIEDLPLLGDAQVQNSLH